MRRSQRLIAAAVVIALSGALAGCTGGMSSFDPSDLLDFLDTKKKLPGERKPVFPEGVPGLEQGVPKGLYKGSAQEQIDQQNAQAAAAAAAAPPPPRLLRRNLQPRRTRTPRRRKRAAPRRRRRLPSPRRSSAAAPLRHRLINPRHRRSPRNRRNSLLRHFRRRCRAAPSRANFEPSFH